MHIHVKIAFIGINLSKENSAHATVIHILLAKARMVIPTKHALPMKIDTITFTAIFRISPLSALVLKCFGFHQSNFRTWPGRSTLLPESELEFLFISQLEYRYDVFLELLR